MPLEIIPGNGPLIVAMPYTGTNIRRELVERLHDQSRYFTSNDRYLDRLLSGLAQDATTIRTNFHRYVSDVDAVSKGSELRARDGMLGVIPLIDRDGTGIWDTPPSVSDARVWRALYFAPYHAALATQIARVRAKYGHAIVLNCRARRDTNAAGSDVPDIEFSTHLGASCAVSLSMKLATLVKSSSAHSVTFNGQLRTGLTTRQYGRPKANTHAFDMDVHERCYLTEEREGEGGHYDAEKAGPLRETLREVMDHLSRWTPY
ncbi:N-formylglutamate amidohydrolase [Roseobacter denitrificans]|uniref:N-formylglutamate amidohydrolase, putative n=1 Tax=Roseobacter denitrificans (strain ATCC 33942 / OCh 114) TaxID=375451 RepID=Q168D0_ROSDO|nr:N-formylglutamate amidohydrolase [Roseobacter denitrificans]ABG31663.1 n-formylglutamate amidohydrolase, putative [Roseobacter denitrificans OCh 114]AVL54640.1 N-formylglutamate amidohydrolase [Roseobacter denitrificans]SFF88644.1 formiminoglutamase [Roseobacter denitrificans OCh 114]